ncbi:hypothetical protein AMTR_s00095p00106810 [Amborella trichopoda]|uniref:Uncharacterized protein n=1 Tax=Amborella trichopoda TaxID=13333 RepID=W1NT67_AMBTC|nr:hypothetical protein AMTR_s00095p00106810 [Amborella trichopoda]
MCTPAVYQVLRQWNLESQCSGTVYIRFDSGSCALALCKCVSKLSKLHYISVLRQCNLESQRSGTIYVLSSSATLLSHSASALSMCVPALLDDALQHCVSALRQCITLESQHSDTVYVRSGNGSYTPALCKCTPAV